MRRPSSSPEHPAVFSDEIHRTVQIFAVDHDLNHVAVAQLADRAAGQRFGRDVTDARACRKRH